MFIKHFFSVEKGISKAMKDISGALVQEGNEIIMKG